jgi:hypothetical protein
VHAHRRAARLLRGVRIEVAPHPSGPAGALSVTQVCAVGWLSTTEAFPLAPGSGARHRRRDLRRGGQRGTLEGAAGGVVTLAVEWGEPLAGRAVDEIRFVPGAAAAGGAGAAGGGGGGRGDEIHVVSSAHVGGQEARFKWVAVRRG